MRHAALPLFLICIAASIAVPVMLTSGDIEACTKTRSAATCHAVHNP